MKRIKANSNQKNEQQMVELYESAQDDNESPPMTFNVESGNQEDPGLGQHLQINQFL